MSAENPLESKNLVLPCGLLEEGKLQKDAEIIPMTGKVRKMIARPEIRQNPAKVIDTLLSQCLVGIGKNTRIRKGITDKLFLADRDFLIMEIRKLSLGNQVNAQMQCDACGAKLSVSVDLASEVNVKTIEDMGIKIEDDVAVFTLESLDPEFKAKFRLPIGSDQHAIANMFRKNPVAANYALYQNCLQEWNGHSVYELDPDLFDRLPLPVLDKIDEEFMEILPGPDMRVPVDCIECGNEMIMGLESSDFLFRLPKKGRG